MSKTMMWSSLFGAVLTLAVASYKTMDMVAESRCKIFPERCGQVDAIATTETEPSLGTPEPPVSDASAAQRPDAVAAP